MSTKKYIEHRKTLINCRIGKPWTSIILSMMGKGGKGIRIVPELIVSK